MTSVLHIVPGLDLCGNGMAVVARSLQKEQGSNVIDASVVEAKEILAFDEIWVHSTWTWNVWRVSLIAMVMKKKLLRMPHGNLDPVRIKYNGWKKWLAGPIERYILRKCDKIVVTCDAEKKWIEAYLGKRCPKVEVIDVKRFFSLGDRSQGIRPSRVLATHRDASKPSDREAESGVSESSASGRALHLLYLGRRHPLKGLEYLEQAVKGIEGIELRIVSNAFGEEKEKVWDWCDVLVLPTLSENFGLVVAEALERGKGVITTDGAPAWDPGDRGQESGIGVGYDGRLLYLKGYREGSNEKRVQLLKAAIEKFIN